MAIVNKTFVINKKNIVIYDLINEYFEQNSLIVVRWAIVEVTDESIVVSAAVEV